MADFVTELAALRLAAVTPREAADAFVGLLHESVPCRTFDIMKDMTLAAANMTLPATQPSSGRTALLKLAIIPRLELQTLSPGEVLFAAGTKGRSAYWFLKGVAEKVEAGGSDSAVKTPLKPWDSVGWDAMVGVPYQCVAVTFAALFWPCLQALPYVHGPHHSSVSVGCHKLQ
jgi:hypothetical protein